MRALDLLGVIFFLTLKELAACGAGKSCGRHNNKAAVRLGPGFKRLIPSRLSSRNVWRRKCGVKPNFQTTPVATTGSGPPLP